MSKLFLLGFIILGIASLIWAYNGAGLPAAAIAMLSGFMCSVNLNKISRNI